MNLTIYMKSGNAIKITRVKAYTFKNTGNGIFEIVLEQDLSWWLFPRRLLVKTIDLSQIEAVVRH